MKTEQEIRDILMGVIDASKDLYIVKGGNWYWKYWETKEDKDIPTYYDGYRKAVMQSERIENHAEVDMFPEKLFHFRAPNQNEEENEYIRKNYKNTTHPVFMDYIAITSRGLQDNNWSIVYPEGSTESEDYNKYISEGIDVFGSVESYVKSIVPKMRAIDPNGVMTFTLKDPVMVERDGEMVVSDTDRPEPQPKYYKCAQVVHWEWSKSAMFESIEKSVVDYNGKRAKVGRVFYFYDDENIWKIEQTGKFIDHKFDAWVIYNHGLGYLPCKKLAAVPSILKSDDVYYTSRFYYSVDLLDWALLYANYLNVSIANVCFPFRWMIGDECDFQDGHGSGCVDGKVAGEHGFKDCPSCGGTGLKIRTSPMKTYLLKSEKGQDKGDTSFPQPIGFISPETNTLEFTRDMAAQYTADARKMLHVYTTNDTSKGDDTATRQLLDLKAMYAFVQPDSDQTFDIFQFLLDVIGNVREGNDFEGAKLTYPNTFDFRTDADILEDIKVARESGAPTHIINSLIYQYISNRFYAETEMAKVSELISASDRLLTLGNEEIIQRKAQGAVSNWEIVLHDSAFTLVNELIDANPDFLNLELQEQVTQLEAKAKEKTPSGVNTNQERATRLLNGVQ